MTPHPTRHAGDAPGMERVSVRRGAVPSSSGGRPAKSASKELRATTSTQKIYWDPENKIVWGKVFRNVTTEELARENIDAQERVRDSLNREMTRVLVDMCDVTEMSKAARDYFGNERTASIQRATALLVRSPVSTVIGNFFMGLNKPISPTRMFTDPEMAVQWLRTFSDA